jgi:YVTN family beta-propeller protein
MRYGPELCAIVTIVIIAFFTAVIQRGIEEERERGVTVFLIHAAREEGVEVKAGTQGKKEGACLFDGNDTNHYLISDVVKVTLPDGTKYYVADPDNNIVSVTDLTKNRQTTTIFRGGRPCEMKMTPDGKKVYVLKCDDAILVVISTESDILIGVLSVMKAHSYGLHISSNGEELYVVEDQGSSIFLTVIDTTRDQVVATHVISQPVKAVGNPSLISSSPSW